MTETHALGGLSIVGNGDGESFPGQRQRRLVAMLLIHRNAVVSVDRLADTVFAGEPTAAASTTLRSYVGRLRKVIDGNGSGVTLLAKPPGYVLVVPDGSFDVGRLESLLGEGRARLSQDDAVGASSVFAERSDCGGDAVRRVRRRGLGSTRIPAAR